MIIADHRIPYAQQNFCICNLGALRAILFPGNDGVSTNSRTLRPQPRNEHNTWAPAKIKVLYRAFKIPSKVNEIVPFFLGGIWVS